MWDRLQLEQVVAIFHLQEETRPRIQHGRLRPPLHRRLQDARWVLDHSGTCGTAFCAVSAGRPLPRLGMERPLTVRPRHLRPFRRATRLRSRPLRARCGSAHSRPLLCHRCRPKQLCQLRIGRFLRSGSFLRGLSSRPGQRQLKPPLQRLRLIELEHPNRLRRCRSKCSSNSCGKASRFCCDTRLSWNSSLGSLLHPPDLKGTVPCKTGSHRATASKESELQIFSKFFYRPTRRTKLVANAIEAQGMLQVLRNC